MKFKAEISLSTALRVFLNSSYIKSFENFFDKTLGKRIFITLETETKSRSLPQNSYYWGVIIDLLSEHTGFTQDEMHEILKHKFLRRTVWIHTKHNTEEQSIITRSTTDLSTKEFEEYLSQIRTWASADLGLWMPEPNEPVNAV